MFKAMGVKWRRFKAEQPGERFTNTQRDRLTERTNRWTGVLFVVLGIVLTLIGIVALFAPGPGLLLMLTGLGLMAREWAPMARVLDRLEVRGRRAAMWSLRWWKQAALPARAALVTLAVLVVAGIGYGAWVGFIAD